MTTSLIADSHLSISPRLQRTYDQALSFSRASLAPSTLRAYKSDYKIFSEWCFQHNLQPLPALPETVALFLTDQASSGLATVSLERRIAAIRFAHAQSDHPSPSGHRIIEDVMRGIRRQHGTRPLRQKDPLLDHHVVQMLSLCPGTTIGIRDRAIMALAFAGAFRRSELVALTISDLTFTPNGNLSCLVRRSKTDKSGVGFEKPILNGTRIMPVTHLRQWIEHAGIDNGLLFRRIDYGGAALERGLASQWVSRIIKHYAERIGLDSAKVGAHSMRSGFITSAGERNASFDRIMEVTGQTDPRTVKRYLRRPNMFKNHVGEDFL